MSSTKECIIIAGPTAVGKTAAAIRLALSLGTEIISADSRQCYREMNIGVARPTEEELAAVKHHFIADHSITENITAASFAKEAHLHLQNIFRKSDKAVVCGGTGLYIKALAEGLDEIPSIPEHIRNEVIQFYQQSGKEALQSRLMELDPAYASSGEMENPQRMMRALEVFLHTGNSIKDYHRKKNTDALGNIRFSYSIMDLPREELYTRINHRVDDMITAGLEEEVESLIPFRDRPALQTVGYKEFFDYFAGNCTRNEAIEKIKQHTRQYAKRQMTWFRKIIQ